MEVRPMPKAIHWFTLMTGMTGMRQGHHSCTMDHSVRMFSGGSCCEKCKMYQNVIYWRISCSLQSLHSSYKLLHERCHDPLHHWQPVRNCETANCLEKESPQPNLTALYQLKVTDRSCRPNVKMQNIIPWLETDDVIDWTSWRLAQKMLGKAAKTHRSSSTTRRPSLAS